MPTVTAELTVSVTITSTHSEHKQTEIFTNKQNPCTRLSTAHGYHAGKKHTKIQVTLTFDLAIQ